MLIKTLEIKNAPAPTKDLPFFSGIQYFMPTNAAIQSDMIRMSHEVITRPLEKNIQLIKSPRAI